MDPLVKRLIRELSPSKNRTGWRFAHFPESAPKMSLDVPTDHLNENGRCENCHHPLYVLSAYGDTIDLVPYAPRLEDLRDSLPQDDLDEIFEEARDAHVYEDEELYERADEMSLDEMLAADTSFLDTLLETAEEGSWWHAYCRRDALDFHRTTVWGVAVPTIISDFSEAEYAALVARVTGTRVYLLSVDHGPDRFDVNHGFLLCGSEDMTLDIALSYICCQQVPPPEILGTAISKLVSAETDVTTDVNVQALRGLLLYSATVAEAELRSHGEALRSKYKVVAEDIEKLAHQHVGTPDVHTPLSARAEANAYNLEQIMNVLQMEGFSF